jgi:hypothetical protein
MSEPGHFHIEWLPSGEIGWQSFSTLEDAERSARKLVQPGECFVIAPMSGKCKLCVLMPRRASRAEKTE